MSRSIREAAGCDCWAFAIPGVSCAHLPSLGGEPVSIQKKKMAILVAAALCTSAHAEVVVYGMAMPFLEQVKGSNATVGAPSDRPNMVAASAYTGFNDAARQRITVGTSHLGFRGSEDIAPQLKAVFQMESGFQIDQNAGAGLGGRDSKIGLQHAVFGEIFLG